MNDVYTMERKGRELPFYFEVIGYPPCQCTGAAQSDDQGQDQGVKTRTVYLHSSFFKQTTISRSHKILDEWIADARAGEIVPSHKFQILGEDETCRIAY